MENRPRPRDYGEVFGNGKCGASSTIDPSDNNSM